MTARRDLPGAPARTSLLRNEQGVAAVEFGLILPLMIGLYLGCAELTQGIMADRKLTLVARTLSDLVAQQQNQTPVDDTTMSSIFAAASAIMSPFDVTPLKMTVTSVNIAATGTASASTYNNLDATVKWSQAGPHGGTLRACAKLTPVANTASASPSTLPQGLYASGGLVIADVSYKYTPRFGSSLLAWSSTDSLINMKTTTYMRPRSWTTAITMSATGTGYCP